MPKTADLVVNNGTANITFTPELGSSTHVVAQDLTVSRLDLRPKIHFDRPSSENGGVKRRQLRVTVPYEVTDATGKVVVKTATFTGFVTSPDELTPAQRKIVRVLGANALLTAAAQATFDNPEWFYA